MLIWERRRPPAWVTANQVPDSEQRARENGAFLDFCSVLRQILIESIAQPHWVHALACYEQASSFNPKNLTASACCTTESHVPISDRDLLFALVRMVGGLAEKLTGERMVFDLDTDAGRETLCSSSIAWLGTLARADDSPWRQCSETGRWMPPQQTSRPAPA